MSDMKYQPVLSKPELDAAMDAVRRLLQQNGVINSGMETFLGGALEKLEQAVPVPTSQLEVVRTAANLQTWEERCVAEAIREFGLRDEADIRDHVAAAQTDNDYLVGQDEALESLIYRARAARGTDRSLEQVIADGLADAPSEGMEP